MIKAIETEYNGYKFRSRLEARWAVFFDSAGIKYEYEKEGYEINGTRYLPDFYLPELDAHIEVKANVTSAIRDIKKCESMIVWGGPIKKIIVLSDVPKTEKINGIWHFPCLFYDSGQDRVVEGWFYFCDSCLGKVVCQSYGYKNPLITLNEELYVEGPYKVDFDISPKWELFLNENYNTLYDEDDYYRFNKKTFDAYKIARQARFEYGETPVI